MLHWDIYQGCAVGSIVVVGVCICSLVSRLVTHRYLSTHQEIREISIDYCSVGFNSGRVVEIGRLSVNTHLDLPTVSHLVSIQCSGREILSGSKVVLSP